ncbi:MAG: response regulator [Archangium sp.]
MLVVDDDPVSRLMVRGRLAATFDVREATNGQQAVEVAREWPPDAILLDVEMPVMDGVTAAGELKKLAGDRLMPIFLVSGADEISTLGRGLAAGADDFFPSRSTRASSSPSSRSSCGCARSRSAFSCRAPSSTRFAAPPSSSTTSPASSSRASHSARRSLVCVRTAPH